MLATTRSSGRYFALCQGTSPPADIRATTTGIDADYAKCFRTKIHRTKATILSTVASLSIVSVAQVILSLCWASSASILLSCLSILVSSLSSLDIKDVASRFMLAFVVTHFRNSGKHHADDGICFSPKLPSLRNAREACPVSKISNAIILLALSCCIVCRQVKRPQVVGRKRCSQGIIHQAILENSAVITDR